MVSSSEEPAPAAANKIPAAALTGDVGVAAPGSKADGQGYVGVWVADAADCATIGSGNGRFAVITLSTYRDGPSAIYGNFAKGLTNGTVTFTLAAPAGQMALVLAQSAPDQLLINGQPMVRCSP